MTCPLCSAAFEEPPQTCPACQLRLGALDTRFGVVPWHRAGITDTTGVISDRQITKLEKWRAYLHQRFPQVKISIFVHRLPPGCPLRAYSFWLFNRGSFHGAGPQFGQNRAILLTLDPAAGAAAITIGYGLEPYLSEPELRALLEHSAPAFRAGHHARGIRQCIQALVPLLRRNVLAAGSPAPARPIAPAAAVSAELY